MIRFSLLLRIQQMRFSEGTGVNALIGVGQACLLYANAGDLVNRDFLVIDANGSGNYEAGSDFVIDVTGFTGTLALGLFA